MNFMDAFFARDREARFDFITTHLYTATPQRLPTISPDKRVKLKTRQLLKIYASLFNVDSIYEYDVIREIICRINDCYGYKKPRATLGHWIPMGSGGDHAVHNWFIQERLANTYQGDKIPTEPKWSFERQIQEIEKLLVDVPHPENVAKVRSMYTALMEIYHGEA